MQILDLEKELVAIGLKPALQRRSQKTRLALLEACRALVGQKDFASLSVEQVCKRADCSVGAFYNHFPTRDALLEALVVWVCLEAREKIDRLCAAEPRSAHLRQLVDMTVANYRDGRLFLRAVTSASMGNRTIWEPIKALGQHLVTAYLKTSGELASDSETRIRFGFQAMFGLLNNELIHEPGPFGLTDLDLTDRLCELIERKS